MLVARMEPENVVYLDVSYLCDNVAPPWEGLKRMMSLTLLAVARMVVRNTKQLAVIAWRYAVSP